MSIYSIYNINAVNFVIFHHGMFSVLLECPINVALQYFAGSLFVCAYTKLETVLIIHADKQSPGKKCTFSLTKR